jgi:uncharacterized Zn-finger protein
MSSCNSETSSNCDVLCNVDGCGKRFATKSNLARHKREDHKIENLKPGRPKKHDTPPSEVLDDFSAKKSFDTFK